MLAIDYPIWAVVFSTALAFGLGLLWYHPKMLGTKWVEARGKTISEAKPAVPRTFFSFLLWALAASFYGFLVIMLGVGGIAALISLSCLLWVAFAMPPVLMGSLFTGYPFQAVAIDSAYQLGGYYVFALVFAFMGY